MLLRSSRAASIVMSLPFFFLEFVLQFKNSFPKFKNTNRKKIIPNPISYMVTILDGKPLCSIVTISNGSPLCFTITISNDNPSAF